jgi:predicted nucleic acid-binding protein
MILIDSSAWIFVLGQKALPSLRDRVTELVLDNQAATAPPVMFEIMRGARTLREAETLRSRLSSLHVFPFAEPDWTEAAEWGSQIARKGLTVKSMDLLIAFVARKHGLSLLHADADFDRLAKKVHLKVESWVEETKRHFR